MNSFIISSSKQGSQSSIQATFLSDDARDDGNDGVIVDDHVSMNLLQDRIHLANKISVLEQEMADEYYTPSRMNEDVIPDVANEMNPGIRFISIFVLLFFIFLKIILLGSVEVKSKKKKLTVVFYFRCYYKIFES